MIRRLGRGMEYWKRGEEDSPGRRRVETGVKDRGLEEGEGRRPGKRMEEGKEGRTETGLQPTRSLLQFAIWVLRLSREVGPLPCSCIFTMGTTLATLYPTLSS